MVLVSRASSREPCTIPLGAFRQRRETRGPLIRGQDKGCGFFSPATEVGSLNHSCPLIGDPHISSPLASDDIANRWLVGR
jgi:hypothetical protein